MERKWKENGKKIYYPLSEESCLLLYEIISDITFNILLNIVSNEFIINVQTDLEKTILNFDINIKKVSAEENLKMVGWTEEQIEAMKLGCDGHKLFRLADNSSNVEVYTKIFSNLVIDDN